MKEERCTEVENQDRPGALPGQDSLREDLDASLRHLHFMGMQTKHDLVDMTSRLYAIIEELVANGQLDLRSFEERRLRLREKEEARLGERVYVQINAIADKYALTELPDIDCQAYLDVCKARCCTLVFPLSFQDLDERIVQWDYAAPYQIRRGADGFCVHLDRKDRTCTVYDNRPVACRTYECRNDRRIWANFDQRILAAEVREQETGPDQAAGLSG